MRIEIENGKAKIFTPYNDEFVERLQGFGGAEWTGKCWTVPEHAVDEVREVMLEIFGENDINVSEKVKVKINFKEEVFRAKGPVTIFGKSIATARGRDGNARISEDVVFIKGKAHGGGSRVNWGTVIDEGSIVTITNVPVTKLDDPNLPEGASFEVIGEYINPDDLRKEKKRLLERIEVIDECLSKCSKNEED